MALTPEGVGKSDEAMVDKGTAMIQEALDESAEAVMDQPVKLKTGNFSDADSFHRAAAKQPSTEAPTAPACSG